MDQMYKENNPGQEKIFYGFICSWCRQYFPAETAPKDGCFKCPSCQNHLRRISSIELVCVEKGKEFFLSTELLLLLNAYAGKKVSISIEEL